MIKGLQGDDQIVEPRHPAAETLGWLANALTSYDGAPKS